MPDALSNNSSSLIVPRAFCRVHLPRITRFCCTPPLVQFCRYTARSTVSREHRLGSCNSQEMSITAARKRRGKESRGLGATQIYAARRNPQSAFLYLPACWNVRSTNVQNVIFTSYLENNCRSSNRKQNTRFRFLSIRNSIGNGIRNSSSSFNLSSALQRRRSTLLIVKCVST